MKWLDTHEQTSCVCMLVPDYCLVLHSIFKLYLKALEFKKKKDELFRRRIGSNNYANLLGILKTI